VPAPEILPMLTYAAQATDVVMTMVDGNVLYENGQYLTLDREKVIADVLHSTQRLLG
jgi:5-methylthioadenosine/S-adenosylhomocysteine deaminase